LLEIGENPESYTRLFPERVSLILLFPLSKTGVRAGVRARARARARKKIRQPTPIG
jgi:hypothetical protein